MSRASMTLGTSRLFTSGTPDGAHRARWLYALDPWPPVWPMPARTTAARETRAEARERTGLGIRDGGMSGRSLPRLRFGGPTVPADAAESPATPWRASARTPLADV